jgi:hypothetical protein
MMCLTVAKVEINTYITLVGNFLGNVHLETEKTIALRCALEKRSG